MIVFALLVDALSFYFAAEILLRKWRAHPESKECHALILGSGLLSFATGLGFSLCLASVLFLAEMSLPLLRSYRLRERAKAFDLSLARALVSVATSLRAGLTLRESVKLAAQNDEAALREEWLRALKETDLGDPFDFALTKVSDRVSTWASRMAMKGMSLSVSQGGKLPQLLMRIAHTIDETQRVEGRLRALTAQGRTQAILLIGAPPVMGCGMWFYDREKMALLFTTPPGQALFVGAVLLWALGIYLTKKTLEFEV